LKFIKAKVELYVETEQGSYSRNQESLSKDMHYYKESGTLEMVECFYAEHQERIRSRENNEVPNIQEVG